MVLEQIFKVRWIEAKEHAFFLGLIYSLVGFVSARYIFPSSTGLMAVAFTSILIIPSLSKLLLMEENVEIREKKFNLKQLFIDHEDILKVYFFLFLGVFTAFFMITLIFPMPDVSYMFFAQAKVIGLSGFAAKQAIFMNIITNNLTVLFVCLVLSLVYGAGSILFITWNASVWGVAFAFFAKEAVFLSSENPFFAFVMALMPSMPHMITEAFAYISAAIVGGVVSKAMLREKLFSKKFKHIITDALIFLGIGIVLVLIAAFVEVQVM